MRNSWLNVQNDSCINKVHWTKIYNTIKQVLINNEQRNRSTKKEKWKKIGQEESTFKKNYQK